MKRLRIVIKKKKKSPECFENLHELTLNINIQRKFTGVYDTFQPGDDRKKNKNRIPYVLLRIDGKLTAKIEKRPSRNTIAGR